VGDAVGGLGNAAQAAGGKLYSKSEDADTDAAKSAAADLQDQTKDLSESVPASTESVGKDVTESAQDMAGELGDKAKT
jgi:hypothetical protein